MSQFLRSLDLLRIQHEEVTAERDSLWVEINQINSATQEAREKQLIPPTMGYSTHAIRQLIQRCEDLEFYRQNLIVVLSKLGYTKENIEELQQDVDHLEVINEVRARNNK